LYDALRDTGGDILVATNAAARKAAALFLEAERCDIHPAAAIATASLAKAAADGRVPKEAIVMLNITGGGEALYKQTLAGRNAGGGFSYAENGGKEKHLWYLQPSHVFAVDAATEDIVERIENLFPLNN
jgi:cysteate synthase